MKDRYGVYQTPMGWYCRHYKVDVPAFGPFPTKAKAMEVLLKELGFEVENN